MCMCMCVCVFNQPKKLINDPDFPSLVADNTRRHKGEEGVSREKD